MAIRISSRAFVGRDDEQAVLASALATAAGGGAATILMAGEAGVGKTRLLAEFRRMAHESGATIGIGGGVGLAEGALPFGPIAGALHELLTGVDDDTLGPVLAVGGGDLVRVLPGLGHRFPGLEPSRSDEWFRARLFEAVLSLLEALAKRSTVVIAFEDIHWADAASLDLIGLLIRSPRRRRVVIVATYRSDELHRRHPLLPWLAEIGRVDGLERLELERLTPEEVAAQVAGIIDGSPSRALLDEIGRRSAGNPFYVEELLAADVRESGRLPASLREVLLGRLGTLGHGGRSVVDVVSVAGQPIDPELIAAVVGGTTRQIAAWIDEAVENHVLVVAEPATGALDFRHALVQEAVHDELLPGDDVRLHRAFGSALEAHGPPEAALVAGWWAQRAHHAIEARDQALALVASVNAGRAAFDVAAFEAAHDHFERAIELLDAVPDGMSRMEDDRVDLIVLAAEAAAYAGFDTRSTALRRAALAALAPADPRERRASLLLDLSQDRFVPYEEALGATREANEFLADGPPTALRARAEASLARDLSATEQWAEALEVAARAVATAEAAADPSAEALARIRLARSLAAVGRQLEGEEEAERALGLARLTRDRKIVGIVFTHAARVHEGVGDARGSARLHAEAAALGAELGIRDNDFELFRAWNNFQFGEWTTTSSILADHERLAPELDWRFHLLSAIVDARFGRHDAARAHLELEAHPDPGTSLMVRAECAIWGDRPAEAAEHARAGLAAVAVPYQYETWKGWLFRTLARAEAELAVRARRRKRVAEAAAAAERAEAAALHLEHLIQGPVSYRDRHGGELPASLAHAKAEVARAAGRHEPLLWADAAHEWHVVDRPFEVAYARWREGEAILGSSGSRADARSRLAEAVSIARRLGAEPITSAVEKLAARARIRLEDEARAAEAVESTPRGSTIGPHLTQREREVLALLCRGETNRRIAESLFITENTAGVHVSNILAKLDVGSRTEAVAVAHMAGLVSPRGQ